MWTNETHIRKWHAGRRVMAETRKARTRRRGVHAQLDAHCVVVCCLACCHRRRRTLATTVLWVNGVGAVGTSGVWEGQGGGYGEKRDVMVVVANGRRQGGGAATRGWARCKRREGYVWTNETHIRKKWHAGRRVVAETSKARTRRGVRAQLDAHCMLSRLLSSP